MVPADSSGHYVWINLGAKLGIHDVQEEKRVFQKLLDGGVYIVSLVVPATRSYGRESRCHRLWSSWD